jgi:putative metalloprotease
MKKLIVLCLAACALQGCATMDTARATAALSQGVQAYALADAQINASVTAYIAQLDRENTILTGNNLYAQRMARIAANIDGRDGIVIKVYQNPEANAFAVADGNVRVYSGLMDIMSDSEILGVIGHEIGHVKNNDSRDAFKAALLTSVLREGIASTGNVAAAISGSMVGDLFETLSSTQYSQKQEYAADDYGYAFLKSRGVNPWAMARSFEKLKSMQASGPASGAVMQLFSTHPELEKRIARMSQRATADGYKRP